MKKSFYCVFIVYVCIIMCACNNKDEDDKEVNEIMISDEEKEFVFETDKPIAYCVDSTGMLYSLINNKNIIKSYDSNGKFIKEYITQEHTASYISVYENRLYYIAFDSLYELDLETGNSTLLKKIKLKCEYYAFSSIAAYKDSVNSFRNLFMMMNGQM